MATYATHAELADFLRDSDVSLPGDDDAVERLLLRSERRVDLLLGTYPDAAPGGLKLDPSTLTSPQRDALARATCACAEHELLVGPAFLSGDSDVVAAGITEIRPPLRTPLRALEALAAAGLIARTMTALPSPPLPANWLLDEYAPALLDGSWPWWW
jgi:hypothetical protein